MPGDTVYLCVKDKNNIFNCKPFSSFHEADKYHKQHRQYYTEDTDSHQQKYLQSTMLPISCFIPTYFHNFILHHKLSNLFIKNKII